MKQFCLDALQEIDEALSCWASSFITAPITSRMFGPLSLSLSLFLSCLFLSCLFLSSLSLSLASARALSLTGTES